jgi:HPt (histidine-containing phosphotransfer) domain-containing protein
MPEAEIAELLRTLWKQSLPTIRERLASLDDVVTEAEAGRLSAAQQAEGASVAHKLAGSLGMFGYHQGTEHARELELLLEREEHPSPLELRKVASSLRLSLPL